MGLRRGLADGFRALAIFLIGYVVWCAIRGKNLALMLSLRMMWLIALANFVFFFARGTRLAETSENKNESAKVDE